MALRFPIYLDNHATTRVDPRVVDAMLPYFSELYGNAASRYHEFGLIAEAAVEHARSLVADLICAKPSEIVFTSGATESINLALKGIAEACASRGDHIVTAVTEHRAVLDSCRTLERYKYRVTYLPVDRHGLVSPEQVQKAIAGDTILVSLMYANNEIGTIAPLQEIAAVCAERGVLLHTDATQAVGKIPLHVGNLGADLVSFSAHKMYGPKGIGALFIREKIPRLKLSPQMDGGGHEAGIRSGTPNVPGIVGFGRAAEIAKEELKEEMERTARLRDVLVGQIRSRLEDVSLNGHPEHRLPNNAHLTFRGAGADTVMTGMKEIAVSSGSACSSAAPEPSHVMKAIGMDDEGLRSSLRFGLGRFTTEEEIKYVVERVVATVQTVRQRTGWYHHSTKGRVTV